MGKQENTEKEGKGRHKERTWYGEGKATRNGKAGREKGIYAEAGKRVAGKKGTKYTDKVVGSI